MQIDKALDIIKERIGVFQKKINSVIVADIGVSKLTLINIGLKGKISIDGLKIVELEAKTKDEVILNSLQSFIHENNILSKYAILRPSLNSLIIKRIQLPAVPDSELEEAVKWQLKEDVSFDLSEAVLDFTVIKKTTKDDGSKVLDIMCAVAQEKEIKSHVLLLKQLGLSCLSVSLIPFGYEKLFEAYLKQEKDESTGILHLSEDSCSFNIYRNNKLEFYRDLSLSFEQLKKSLMSALVSDKGRVELTAQEAEDVLLTIGIPQQDCSYKDKINSTQILSMIRPMLERLAAEIKRSLTYYEARFQGEGVNKIFIFGKGVGIQGVDIFLSKETSLNIQKISLNEKISISSKVDPLIFSQDYASFGLALNYKESINLLPREFRTEKIEKFQKVSLRWITFISFLLLIVSFIFAKTAVGLFKKRLENEKVRLGILSEVVQIKTKIGQLNNLVTEVKNSEIPLARILKKLSNISERELFFTYFSLNFDSNSGSIKGYIKKVSRNPDTILTKLVADMKNSDYFSEVNIVSVTKDENRGFEITDFELNIKLF